MVTEYVEVPDERVGIELDEFLCLLYPGWNKGYLRRQVRNGRVLVDGMPAQPLQRLRRNQVVVLDIDEEDDPPPLVPSAPAVPVAVLAETPRALVVHKPSGLAVEPERWLRENPSLAGAALELARDRAVPGEAVEFRPRLVHRIDKGTSGCVLIAKDLGAERILRRAFEDQRVEKRYLALVEGEVPLEDGEERVIDAPIAKADRRGARMRVDASGKPSVTVVRVEARFRGYTWLECRPRTGRTHQIRVHLAAEGFPLAADPLYGRRDALFLSALKAGYRAKPGRVERPLVDRLTLHAASIEWARPLEDEADGSPLEPLRAESPLPDDLARTLKQLAKVRPHRGTRHP